MDIPHLPSTSSYTVSFSVDSLSMESMDSSTVDPVTGETTSLPASSKKVREEEKGDKSVVTCNRLKMSVIPRNCPGGVQAAADSPQPGLCCLWCPCSRSCPLWRFNLTILQYSVKLVSLMNSMTPPWCTPGHCCYSCRAFFRRTTHRRERKGALRSPPLTLGVSMKHASIEICRKICL